MKDRLKRPAANIVLIICGRCPWLASLLGKFQHRLDAVFSTHRPTRRDERGQRGPAEGMRRYEARCNRDMIRIKSSTATHCTLSNREYLHAKLKG